MKTSFSTKGKLIIAGLVTLTIGVTSLVWAQSHSGSMDHTTADHNPMGHHIFGGGKMHGADGSGHDEVNMPGLRGINATGEEFAELAAIFRNFETITREVINLPNGIRTATRSSDEDVMNLLVSHVLGMIRRVEEGDDPQIEIQSPTLDILFVQGKEIKTDIDVTDEGIVVTQTSDNPELVAALQKHAIEVSAMADHGMEAVHKMMMQRGH